MNSTKCAELVVNKLPDRLSQTMYGQAVEPSYRATKSRCVCKCRFPSGGGLHRSSYDSYSDLMQIPDWCHVYKSKSPSSTRTRIAALASTSKIYNTSRSTNHKRTRNQIHKLSKQRIQLKNCKIPTIVSSNIKQLTTEFIKKTIVICDGGTHLPTINNKYIGEHFILSISRGDLWVHDTTNPLLGLRMLLPSVNSPVFIRLPREQSLLIMNNGSSICRAMNSCAETQPQSLLRGVSKQVFTDLNIIVSVHSQVDTKEVYSLVFTSSSTVSLAVIGTPF